MCRGQHCVVIAICLHISLTGAWTRCDSWSAVACIHRQMTSTGELLGNCNRNLVKQRNGLKIICKKKSVSCRRVCCRSDDAAVIS